MAIFRKYEFPSEEFYNQLKEGVNQHINTFVELGNLRSEKFSVDVLWQYSPISEWEEYEIWDVEGNGVHTFKGWEFQSDV
jgi:hypothetical protein